MHYNPFLLQDLISQKLVEVLELVGIGDLSVQRGIPLLCDPRGTADLNSGVSTKTPTGRL